MTNHNKHEFLAVIILGLACLVVYSNTLTAPFFFDDNHMIEKNILITNHKYFPLFFKGLVTSYPISKGMCRPLLMLTFAFNYANGGLNPAGYHIVNILVHFLNAALVYFLLKTLSARLCAAEQTVSSDAKKINAGQNRHQGLFFIIALLFAVHPLNTEAVTYISSRSDLLVTFFILCGFIFYLTDKYTLIIVSYILALLTKETALCLPILIVGHCLICRGKNIKAFVKSKPNILLIISFAIITLMYLCYNKLYFSGFPLPSIRPLLSNTLIQSWMSFFYLRLFLWPDNLNFLHYWPQAPSFLQPSIIFSVLGIIILAGLVPVLRKKTPLVSLGIFWYLAGLAPKFYAVLRMPAMEHHFYLPGIGVYIFLAAVAAPLYLRNKKYFLYPSLAVIFICAILTWERNYQLNDPILVWKNGIKKEQLYIGNWINLAMSYEDKKDLNKAKEVLSKALAMSKENKNWQGILYVRLAKLYFLKKDYKQAIGLLNKTLNSTTDSFLQYQIYQSLGIIYQKMKKNDLALDYWNKALSISDSNPRNYSTDLEMYKNMGKIFIEKNQLDHAKKYIDKILQLNPYDYYSYFLLGKIWEKKNNLEKAAEAYKKSIEFKPNWHHSHYALSLVYIMLHNLRAAQELEKTIQLEPDYAPALSLRQYILKPKQ